MPVQEILLLKSFLDFLVLLFGLYIFMFRELTSFHLKKLHDGSSILPLINGEESMQIRDCRVGNRMVDKII
jgi:hypothetical protein